VGKLDSPEDSPSSGPDPPPYAHVCVMGVLVDCSKLELKPRILSVRGNHSLPHEALKMGFVAIQRHL
jgi:hypothetical protein